MLPHLIMHAEIEKTELTLPHPPPPSSSSSSKKHEHQEIAEKSQCNGAICHP